ncbi:MAG: hypothetical protein KatS3mg105_2262 [Gemmatales bacterium]|nr:MAG: hypothetical protein KatS3mg105_2262 [Gemmatales bacterium]
MKNRSYLVCLFLVAATYFSVFGTLLVCTDGLPYVLDNNESYSSLWHAYNLRNFDFWQSFGLADEACSPDPKAHPYLHTHQGNFPRLFAFAIYCLGARTIESQIVVTTFTIGLATIFMGFHFFSRIANPFLALTVCLFMMTDYVQFVQWQVVTYRVWHGFFVFSSVLCLQALAEKPGRFRSILTAINFACLFYFEMVFVFFVTCLSVAYALYLFWGKWRVLGRVALCCAGGACLSVAILSCQLIALMGVDGVIQDARFTFASRNRGQADEQLIEAMGEFYDRHRIVCWPNYTDGSQFLGLRPFIKALLVYHFQPATPLFTLIVLILGIGWIQAVGWYRLGVGGIRMTTHSHRAFACTALLALFACAALFFAALCRDDSYLGLAGDTNLTAKQRLETIGFWAGSKTQTVAALFFAALFCLILVCVTVRDWKHLGYVRLRRWIMACALLVASACFIRLQPRLYQGHWQSLWQAMQPCWWCAILFRGGVSMAMLLAIVLALRGKRWLSTSSLASLTGVVPFLLSGTFAYTAVYHLSPGYMHTGYLHRNLTFYYFVTGTFFSSSIYLLFALARSAFQRQQTSGCVPLGPLTIVATASASVILLGTYWLSLQRVYWRILPPDHFSFVEVLRRPPFRGATFLTNTYALPIAWETKNWVRTDIRYPYLGECQLTENGYVLDQDAGKYLWYADRRSNPAYARPEYCLLVVQRVLKSGLLNKEIFSNGQTPNVAFQQASRFPLVVKSQRSDAVLRHQLVAMDDSGRDRWAILKMDWDFPPYLQRDESGKRVRLSLVGDSSGWRIQVLYRYAHQDGKPEANTIVRLYRVKADKTRSLWKEATGVTHFIVSPAFRGTIQVSVTPATATKKGEEFFSEAVTIPDSLADSASR